MKTRITTIRMREVFDIEIRDAFEKFKTLNPDREIKFSAFVRLLIKVGLRTIKMEMNK